MDPKVAADQRGHGLGVSFDTYTISDRQQKKSAVRKLEAGLSRRKGLKRVGVSTR